MPAVIASVGGGVVRITIITGSRADWNGLGMVGKRLRDEYQVDVRVIAIGQHADNEKHLFSVIADGFDPRVLRTNYKNDMAFGCGSAVTAIRTALMGAPPDIVLLLGDRYEILGAATAAALLRIPIAHIGGGDITAGSIDDKLRYAISALADLHFVTNGQSYDRLYDRVDPQALHEVGAPALDRIRETEIVSRETLFDSLGLQQCAKNIIVCYHAATRDEDTLGGCHQMLSALRMLDADVGFLVLGTNTDTGAHEIEDTLRRFVLGAPGVRVMQENLPPELFYSALAHFDCMVGNSSAALVETASFGIPVVNVGDRQKGRLAPRNVIHSKADMDAVHVCLKLALAGRCVATENPYGDGHSAPRIAEIMVEHLRQ